MDQQQIANLKEQCYPLLEHLAKLRDQNEYDSPKWRLQEDQCSNVRQFIHCLILLQQRKD